MSPISTNSRTHWDHLKYYPCTVDHTQLLRRAFFSLFSSPSHSSVRVLFSLPHFARPASRKIELHKNYHSAFGALSALRNTRVFWRFARKFFLALISRIIFFRLKQTLKELWPKGNLFNCLRIWTVASLTYKLQRHVCKWLILNYFFFESDFLHDHSTFFKSYFEDFL